MVVVDTSVLIDLFKGKDTAQVRKFLELENDEANIAVPYICLQELLQGARNEKEWKLIRDYVSSQTLIGLKHNMASHTAAARIYYNVRKKGVTLRSTIDCLIAQMAIEQNAPLLHSDRDFDSIARFSDLKSAV